MNDTAEKDEDLLNYSKNRRKGGGRLFLGLLLIVIAVLIYAFRNGYLTGDPSKNATDAEYLSKELTKKMRGFDDFVIAELKLMPEGRGTAVGKVKIESDDPLSLLLGSTGLDFHYKDNGYAVTTSLFNLEIASFDFGDIDVKGLASYKAIGSSKFKKTIEKYRLLYYNELFKTAITSVNKNYINNLDGVLLVETEMKFELVPEDFDRAFRACTEAARKDRVLKKAYESMNDGEIDYDEFLNGLEEDHDGDRNTGFKAKRISGAFYINTAEGLTMADLLFEPSEDSTDQSDRHLKIGYTYLERNVGFVFVYDDGTNLIDVLGNGIYNSRAASLNATGNAVVKGEKFKTPEDKEFSFSIKDFRVFRSGEVYAAGSIGLELKDSDGRKTNIFFESEDRLQTIEAYVLNADGTTKKTTVTITR